ncbi:MAG TPA: tRNA glutamyl-Q(34) synthetase GluQRS [Beijerinckiaceae bacterium]|jgi:glutamyl-Q tRNA(Asp) synthetase
MQRPPSGRGDRRSPAPTQPALRFAPSPNGHLHLGHAASALLNATLAARLNGCFLLRIEDIDLARCRPVFVDAIVEDLAWLGLAWEEPVRRQSERFPAYRAAAEPLVAQNLLYPCFCSRTDIARAVAEEEARTGRTAPRDPDGAPLYPGTCRGFSPAEARARLAREPHAWRLDGAGARAAAGPSLAYARFTIDGAEEAVPASPERWGDAVILRKEVPASYHLAVVVDDADQGITHVVRGADLEAATDLHVLLQRLMRLPTPRYHHHPLIRDEAGAKLAKSAGSPSLRSLREAGIGPDEVWARVAAALGVTLLA